MGKKKTKRIYNRISSEEQAQLHTASWWYNHKYLLITGAIGEDMYPNGYKQDVCTYYAADQVRCMSPEEAHAALAPRREREAKIRKRRRVEHQKAAQRRLCADIGKAVPFTPNDQTVVLAVDTTGLESYCDELLSVSITTPDGVVIFESLFKPIAAQWPDAQYVNDISPADVAAAPSITDKIAEIAAILQNVHSIIAFNAAFHLNFLEEYGVKIRDDAEILDPIDEGSIVYGDFDDFFKSFTYKNLRKIRKMCGVPRPPEGLMRSTATCLIVARIWQRLQQPDMIALRDANIAKYNYDPNYWPYF